MVSDVFIDFGCYHFATITNSNRLKSGKSRNNEGAVKAPILLMEKNEGIRP
jgi:hypothetical protein